MTERGLEVVHEIETPRPRPRRARSTGPRGIGPLTEAPHEPVASRAPAGLVAGAISAVGAALTLALNLPGHLSFDSIVQLAEGREGVYGGVHPPVMSWLLGIADAARPGAALFVVFDTILIAGALIAFVLWGRQTSWLAAPLGAAFVVVPQLLIYPAIVWKDVLFAGAAIAGFACMAHAATVWTNRPSRYALLAAALLLLTLAALTRQNGATVLVFAAGAVGWIAGRSGEARKPRSGWILGGAFLAAGAVIGIAGSAALNAHTEDRTIVGKQWESLQTFDLVAALTIEPRLNLSVLHLRSPWLEARLRTDGVGAYSPVRVNPLAPVLDRMNARPASAGLIAAQWEALVQRHPLLYLRVRARALRWVLLTPVLKDCVPVFTGVDGPAEEMQSLGLVARKTPMDRALARYALAFAATPVYSHAAYGALGLVLLLGLLHRRRGPDIAVAAMLASAMAFALSFAVISVACDYRYLYYLDLAVIAASLYAAATWRAIRA